MSAGGRWGLTGDFITNYGITAAWGGRVSSSGHSISMEQVEEFIDSRNKGFCVHCGEWIGTTESNKDHVPTKGLLNPPYPENLPVVEVCKQCNGGFSSDEEYLIAFLGSMLSGSTRPDPVRFPTAAGILTRSPLLGRRIDRSRTVQRNLSGDAELLWEPELDRIERVIVKNARGHVLYEIGEPMLGQPSLVWSCPIPAMGTQQVAHFENIPLLSVWPEVGSRMMIRAALAFNNPNNGQRVHIGDGWQDVQDGVYRYAVAPLPGQMQVKTVINEYLATEVAWNV